MTQKFLLTLSILLLNLNSFAQTDSLRQQILNYRNPEIELLRNGRLMIIDRFNNGDKQKVKELTDYLLSSTSAEQLTFYPAEKWFIFYWTNQYARLLTEMEGFTELHFRQLRTLARPPEDVLLAKLRQQLKLTRILIYDEIKNDSLPDADKAFLLLNFNYLLGEDAIEGLTQETLNVQANQFLNHYAAHPLSGYVRKYIRVEFATSKWGIGFEFFSGYGWFTSSLKEKFTSHVPVGVAFDVAYKRWTLYLRNYIGFGKTEQALPFDQIVWPKNSKTQVFLPEASIGYELLKNRRFGLAPFAGLTSASVSPIERDRQKNEDYDNVGLNFTTSYTVGLNVDIKFAEGYMPAISPRGNSYLFTRIRYMYNMPQFSKKYAGYNGNMHSLTIGFGGLGRREKRVE